MNWIWIWNLSKINGHSLVQYYIKQDSSYFNNCAMDLSV